MQLAFNDENIATVQKLLAVVSSHDHEALGIALTSFALKIIREANPLADE